jgi:hypothetical protein
MMTRSPSALVVTTGNAEWRVAFKVSNNKATRSTRWKETAGRPHASAAVMWRMRPSELGSRKGRCLASMRLS